MITTVVTIINVASLYVCRCALVHSDNFMLSVSCDVTAINSICQSLDGSRERCSRAD